MPTDDPMVRLTRYPDSHWRAVAELYAAAVDADDSPVKRIADAAGVPRSTAARWAARARREGYLTAASKHAPRSGNKVAKDRRLYVLDLIDAWATGRPLDFKRHAVPAWVREAIKMADPRGTETQHADR